MEIICIILIIAISILILKVIFLNDKLNNVLEEIQYLKIDARDKYYKLLDRDIELFKLITDYLDVELEQPKTISGKLVKKAKK